MVSTNLNQGSARIYQFPIGGRAALIGNRNTAISEITSGRALNVVTGSNWYHEAAVLEDQASKPQ